MDVLHSCNDLLKQESSYVLFEAGAEVNMVKKVTPVHILHKEHRSFYSSFQLHAETRCLLVVEASHDVPVVQILPDAVLIYSHSECLLAASLLGFHDDLDGKLQTTGSGTVNHTKRTRALTLANIDWDV